MTTLNTLETSIATAKEIIVEATYGDSWKMTSYMIQVLAKMERYTESLTQDYPETDFYTANVSLNSALELIKHTYEVPVSDDRFEDVNALYNDTVVDFIANQSDDCMADLAFLGNIANFVAEMRTYCWNEYITETGPSQDKFDALKLAKRDEKAVEIATSTAAEAMFAD